MARKERWLQKAENWLAIRARMAGYEDTNDAERLCVDPTMRRVVGGPAKNSYAASTSQMGLFEAVPR